LKKRYLILFLLFFAVGAMAQKVELVSSHPLPKIKHKKNYDNPVELLKIQQSVVKQLRSNGYVTANIDSTVVKDNKTLLYVYLGEKIKWSILDAKHLESDALSHAGYKERLYKNKPLNPTQFATLCNRIVRHYENSGYPFTEVFLDSTSLENGTLYAKLNVVKHQKVFIDSVIIKSNDDISTHLAQNIINIKKGEVYNEAKIKQISNKIKESGLFIETESWKILFAKNETKLYLFLTTNKSSQFNGIAGVQPDPVTNRISITGDVDLRLLNVLKRAELMNVKWKRFQQLSQELTVQATYPFLFQSQFGTDLMLHLYKRDTSFLELEQRAEILYFLNNGSAFKTSVKKYSSQTQSTFLSNEFNTVNALYYGLGIITNRLNYRLNPLKGYLLDLNASLGNKKIDRIDKQIDSDNKVLQGVFDGRLEVFIPLQKKTTIKLSNQARYIFSEQIYNNELFRIGGLKTLRGFDEESIFASFYSIATLELRYLFEQNSNFYLFTDVAYFERQTVETSAFNNASSFGLGVNFETGAGIFSVNYGIGRLNQNPFLVRAAKIHFGFVALF
jgi:outer membrane protein assembly factor BamA